MGFAQIESLARSILGQDRYDAAVDTLNALSLLRDERVLLVNPRILFFK